MHPRFFGILFCILLWHSQIAADSKIVIKGKSNVGGFSFTQTGNFLVKGVEIYKKEADKVYLSENTLLIEVNKFKSANKIALKDFFKLVKSDQYSHIRVEVDHVEFGDNKLKEQNTLVNAHVNISIAGVQNKYIVPVNIVKNNDNLQIKGKTSINIKDFGLSPPVKLLGTIKVDEWIEIEFQINTTFEH